MKQKKRILLLTALIISLILSFITVASAAEKQINTSVATKNEQLKPIFPDITATDTNAVFINYLANRNIFNGFPDGKFHSEEGLTRAQAAVILVKAAGLETPAVGNTGFPDVKADHWAAANIAAATKASYLKGFPDGTFKPDDKLTRAQGIALIMRLSTQKERPPLPALNDLDQNHWAAGEMAVALATEMIGLSADGKQVYPETAMKRGSLARALGTLLTRDPGLYTVSLQGTIKDLKGDIKLTRKGTTTSLQNGNSVYLGDTIKTGVNASACIFYPDGSSVLIKENTEINIKESIGRAFIKIDGSSGTAVENVDIDLKKGTVFGALATKHESTEKQQSRSNYPLLASLDGRQFFADNQDQALPWYKVAQAKKVKMQVDMPWGVAAVRGTFILVSVNPNGTCNVSCLTGNAEVIGQIGNTVPLDGGKSSGIEQGGTAGLATQMSDQDKQAFGAVQAWVVNTALQMDINKEAAPPPPVEMIVEIPGTPVPEIEQTKNTLDVVLNALEASGIQLTEQVKNDLEKQLQELQQELSQTVLETLGNQDTQNNDSSGGDSSSSSVSYINYASPGTYGPTTPNARQTIANSVIVSSRDIILQNMIITGDLILGAGIGDGSVTLKCVNVQGNTIILGGGPNSITIEDCDLYTVTVDNQSNTVRIVARGSSTVGAITLNSGAKLEENELTGAGFSSVTTGSSIPTGATIILNGNFAAVNINVPNLTIQVDGGNIEQINIASTTGGTALTLAAGVSVSTLLVNSAASISGAGQILTAVINSPGVVIEQQPVNWLVAQGISASIGGESRTGGSSSNAELLSMSLSSGTLSPAFSPTILIYSANVANNVNQVTLTVIPQETTATVAVDGVNITNNTYPLSLNVGSNIISIIVTSQDSNSLSYNLTITRAASSACEVTGITSPTGGIISGNNITASVANNISSLTVDVSVSPDATWKLYSDSGYNTEIVNKQINLDVGDNNNYIKVTAQDGITVGYYNLSIRRVSDDATVATLGSNYTVDNSFNTIVANTTVINTNVTVESFLANLSKYEQASWKVVTAGTTISNQTEFNSATAKASSDTLLFGDKLAVKAEDGTTIKVYDITVVLGDPVLGGGTYPGTPSGLKDAWSGFTWGNYRYWVYDFEDNSFAIKIIAYDQSNQIYTTQWQKSNGYCRYINGVSIDTNNHTIIFNTQQASTFPNGTIFTITVPWSDFLISQP